MSQVERFERELAAWFVETAALRTPDYTDDILRQTARVRQRPRWSFPERWLPLSVITPVRRMLRPVPSRTAGMLAILVLLLLLLAIATLVGSPRRLPAPFGPAANGLVAYAVDGDIVAVDSRSGSMVILVGGPARDQYPAWSPDGTRVAFERAVPGGTKAVSANSAGGQLLELIEDPVDAVRGLIWSPDGSALAFSNGDLWIVAADGSGGRRLDIGFRAEFPVWRPPDGREILFSNASGPGLFLVRRDGSVLRPLTFSDGTIVDDGASWTPDGRRLVSARRETGADGHPAYRLHVMIVGVDGRIVDDRVVGPPMLPSIGNNLSPDGTRVLFAIESPDRAGWRVGVVSIDGSEPMILAGPTFTGQERICAWSPDGTLIIVNDVEQQETWLLDSSGGPARRGDWNDLSGEPPAWQRLPP